MSTPAPQVSPAKVAPTLQLIALEQLLPDPNQPRKAFDEAALKELADSIRAEGLVEPIVVRPNGKGFYIVAGERRWRAAKQAGLKELPSIVRTDLKDADVGTLQLVENLQRQDLALPEQCEAVAKLVKQLNGPDGKGGQARAAEKLGKSEAWISKRAGLVGAPKEVRDCLSKGTLVDAEVASGLVELLQVVPDPKKDYTVRDLFERAKDPTSYGGAPTRDEVRDAIRDAKAEIKAREEAAKKAAKTRKAIAEGKKKPDPWAAKQRREKEQKEERNRRWKLLNPALGKFANDATTVVGARVTPPQHNEWRPDAPPASVAAAAFRIHVRGSADQVAKVVSKTGLTLKLECHQFPQVTPEQAKKIEQIVGRALQWEDIVDQEGDKVAKLAAKCGKAITVPVVDLKPATAATSAKDKAKKAATKR